MNLNYLEHLKDHLLEINFGKEAKINPDNVAAITKSYYETNKVELVDLLLKETVVVKISISDQRF